MNIAYEYLIHHSHTRLPTILVVYRPHNLCNLYFESLLVQPSLKIIMKSETNSIRQEKDKEEQQVQDHEHRQESSDPPLQDQSAQPISLRQALEINFNHCIDNEAVQAASCLYFGDDGHQQEDHYDSCQEHWQVIPFSPLRRELVHILDEAIDLLDEGREVESAHPRTPSSRRYMAQ